MEILEYVENSPTFQGKDYLSFRVSASANTRVGINYKIDSVSAITWWRTTSTPTGIVYDDYGKWFDLPYPFRFYGKVYRKVWVCSNGFMSFDSESTSYSPQNIPNSGTPNTLVAGFWRDLNPAKGGSITYYSGLDSSNLYTFVVTWDRVPNYANSNTQTFQITLRQSGLNYEDDIIFSYDAVTLDYTTIIGIEDQTGLKGKSYSSSSINPGGHTLYFSSDVLPKTISYLTIEVQKYPMDYSSAINIQTSETGGYNVKLKQTSNLAEDLFILAIKTAAPILIGTIAGPEAGIMCKLVLITADTANILSRDLSPPQLVGEHSCPYNEGLAYVKAEGYLEDSNDWYLYDSTLATTFIWVFSDPNTQAHSAYINAKLEYYDFAAGSKTISSQCFVGLGVGGGGGSCPYLSTWNGWQYEFDNVLLPSSESCPGEVVDNYILQKPVVPDSEGLYRLLISESENEHSFFDTVELVAIDHQSNVSVAVSPDGEILTYHDPHPPVSAITNEHQNVKKLLEAVDENYYEGYDGSYIILNFGDEMDVTQSAKLVIRSDAIPQVRSPVNIQTMNAAREWQTRATIHTRDYWSTDIIDLSEFLPDAEGNIKVRLCFVSNDKIDFVGLDTSPQATITVHKSELVSAVQYKNDNPTIYGANMENDVRQKLLYDDDNYAELMPHEQIEITYYLSEGPMDSLKRDFMLISRGYYCSLPE